MYWSGYSRDDNLRFVKEAGLVLLESNTEPTFEEGEEAPFLWLLAGKPK